MKRGRSEGQQPEWFPLARHYDHHLTAAHPIWVGHGLRPFPLEVHIHKGMDFGIAFSSGLMQYYGDLLLTPEAGEVWLGTAWEPHAWRTVPEGARFLIMTFLPEVLEEGLGSELSLLEMFALPPRERPRATSAGLRAQMITIGEEIVRESEQKRDGWEIAVRIGLVRALFALHREWKPVKAVRPTPSARGSSISRVMPALNLVHSNPGRRVRAPEAAAACGLALSWFHHVFRQTMGLSYAAFCLRMRLAYAARELLTTDAPVETVADQFGFADASHLYRRFVAKYGCSPAEYRRKGQPTVDS